MTVFWRRNDFDSEAFYGRHAHDTASVRRLRRALERARGLAVTQGCRRRYVLGYLDGDGTADERDLERGKANGAGNGNANENDSRVDNHRRLPTPPTAVGDGPCRQSPGAGRNPPAVATPATKAPPDPRGEGGGGGCAMCDNCTRPPQEMKDYTRY